MNGCVVYSIHRISSNQRVIQARGIALLVVVSHVFTNRTTQQRLEIAVLSDVAFDARRDTGLRAIAARHLFEPSTRSLLLHRTRYLHKHAYDFIEMCVLMLKKADMHRAAAG